MFLSPVVQPERADLPAAQLCSPDVISSSAYVPKPLLLCPVIPVLVPPALYPTKVKSSAPVIYLPALYPTQTDLSALLASPPAYEPTKTLLETPEVGFAQA